MTTANSALMGDNSSLAMISILRGWDRLERTLGGEPIVDFDVTGAKHSKKKYANRYQVLESLIELQNTLSTGDADLIRQTQAHIAYLRALMGEKIPFADYVMSTIGIPAVEYSRSYIKQRLDLACKALDAIGIKFDRSASLRLEAADEPVPMSKVRKLMRHLYSQRVGELEVIIGRRLDVNYFIEFVNVDAYWKYWVDGNSARFRLRINSQRGTFGRSELVQFVYHELLAHCCQMAAFHKSIQEKQIALFHGCTTVHGPEQFLFEGLAQSLPLFLRNEDALDPLLIARIRLAHFRSLVNHNVHIMINSGSTIEQCVKYVEDWVPFGNRGLIAHGLHSISNNCLFRCYQFVYPLSMDFFVSLAERCVEASASGLLARFYAQPLYYDAIQRLQES